MKVFSAAQIKTLDQFTIQQEPISSLDLMERAALTFTKWFCQQFPDSETPIVIFCGVGNNGGDGLAIARLLNQAHYNVKVFWCKIGQQTTPDFDENFNRLPIKNGVQLDILTQNASFPEIPTHAIVIDAIFGIGMNRPIEGFWESLIEYINASPNTVVAVDVPSGLICDDPLYQRTCIEADFTFSFEFPKKAFFFPENQDFVGEWIVQSIGLSPQMIAEIPCMDYYLDEKLAKSLIIPRAKFAHKGNFGHSLLVVGNKGKMGAAILAARACLRSGTGLLTLFVPQSESFIVQTTVPEAMTLFELEKTEYYFQEKDLNIYASIGIGCGTGTDAKSSSLLFNTMRRFDKPMVIDADAITNISAYSGKIETVPKNSILTPHPKEFERLFGETAHRWDAIELMRQKAKELQIFIVLKGAHTCIATPEGECYFNSTGNPGMATAGSGDVLTGIITALLSQGYPPKSAALLGVYVHGLAGDFAAKEKGFVSLIAGDIVDNLPLAFREVQK